MVIGWILFLTFENSPVDEGILEYLTFPPPTRTQSCAEHSAFILLLPPFEVRSLTPFIVMDTIVPMWWQCCYGDDSLSFNFLRIYGLGDALTT